MKKLLLLSGLTILAALFVRCSDDNGKDDPTYTVTVTTTGNGTASASAESATAGAIVTLTATPEDGHRFSRWTVLTGEVTLSDETAATATFTMPEHNVSVRAEFVDNTAGGGEKLVKQIVRDHVTEEFIYDDEGRLIRVILKSEGSGNQEVNYTYTGNTVTAVPTNGSTETYTLDSEGRLTKSEYTNGRMEFKYDASGYLETRTEVFGSSQANRTYTWSNGNITRYERDDMNIYVTYTYHERENRLNVEYDNEAEPRYIRFNGMTSLKFSDTKTTYYDNMPDKAQYKYTFDGDGYPTSIETEYPDVEADKQVITITYY